MMPNTLSDNYMIKKLKVIDLLLSLLVRKRADPGNTKDPDPMENAAEDIGISK